jgi:antitoxin PrlF
MMIKSKITSKAQTTVPLPVRAALRVRPGDELAYEIEGDRVILTKAGREDAEHLNALQTLLAEWSDPANDVFDDL